jgi:hypothetical protein
MLSAAAFLAASAGCSSIRCRIDSNYDQLEMEAVEDPDPDSSFIVEYADLTPRLRDPVDAAISDGAVRQCHQFDNDEDSDIKTLYDFIAARWEEADDPPSDLRSRTYLKREGMYFGMLLSTLDAVAIYSFPDDSG